jgi:hypothetical protein
MSEKAQDVILTAEDHLGVLSKEFHFQLLNCSSSGCLVETRSPIEVGTIGTLRLTVEGSAFTEDVQIVRCQQIEGAGSVYHVGAKFLWTASPHSGSLRRAMGNRMARRDDGRTVAKPVM